MLDERIIYVGSRAIKLTKEMRNGFDSYNKKKDEIGDLAADAFKLSESLEAKKDELEQLKEQANSEDKKLAKETNKKIKALEKEMNKIETNVNHANDKLDKTNAKYHLVSMDGVAFGLFNGLNKEESIVEEVPTISDDVQPMSISEIENDVKIDETSSSEDLASELDYDFDKPNDDAFNSEESYNAEEVSESVLEPQEEVSENEEAPIPEEKSEFNFFTQEELDKMWARLSETFHFDGNKEEEETKEPLADEVQEEVLPIEPIEPFVALENQENSVEPSEEIQEVPVVDTYTFEMPELVSEEKEETSEQTVLEETPMQEENVEMSDEIPMTYDFNNEFQTIEEPTLQPQEENAESIEENQEETSSEVQEEQTDETVEESQHEEVSEESEDFTVKNEFEKIEVPERTEPLIPEDEGETDLIPFSNYNDYMFKFGQDYYGKEALTPAEFSELANVEGILTENEFIKKRSEQYSNVVNQNSNLKEKIVDLDNEFKQHIDDISNEYKQRMDNMSNEYESNINKLNKNLDDAKEKEEADKAQIAQTQKLNKSLTDTVNEQDKKIKEFEDKFNIVFDIVKEIKEQQENI